MILKIYIFTLLLLGGITAKSQILLNADSSQIKKQLLSQGGRLRVNAVEDGIAFPGYYHILLFKFSESAFEKNGIVLMTFYLTLKNKCFDYRVSYVDDHYLGKLKETFNKPESGLNQVDNRLEWIDPVKKYVIKIWPGIPVNGKNASNFDLEVKSN